MNKKEKSKKIIKILKKEYPDAKCSLKFSNPLEILIATILSAQCTDKRVNIVTQNLFKKYKKAEDYANVPLKNLERDIRSTGFYKNKAKSIKGCCKMIIKEFNGKVPNQMEDLLKLRGVARKTANIVLGNAYKKIEGIPIDTHVKRIVYRLGLNKNTDPNKIEKDLMEIIPKKEWLKFSYLLIEHGRKICKAPVPLCSSCKLNKLCPKKGVLKRK